MKLHRDIVEFLTRDDITEFAIDDTPHGFEIVWKRDGHYRAMMFATLSAPFSPPGAIYEMMRRLG